MKLLKILNSLLCQSNQCPNGVLRTRQSNKIFWSIIALNAIQMMNNFASLQFSFMILFPYKAVFGGIFPFLWLPQQYVTPGIYYAPALPVGTILPCNRMFSLSIVVTFWAHLWGFFNPSHMERFTTIYASMCHQLCFTLVTITSTLRCIKYISTMPTILFHTLILPLLWYKVKNSHDELDGRTKVS